MIANIFRPFRSPASLFLCLAALLLPLILGFFFTPYTPPTQSGFEGERPDLEKALAEARAEWDSQATGENDYVSRQKVLFFETALAFSLPVWGSDFASEGAGYYALILWELEQCDPLSPRAQELNTEKDALAHILEQRDLDGYLSFLKERLVSKGSLEKDQISRQLEDDALRLFATLDGSPLSPGGKFLLQEIRQLRESLDTGVDRYNPVSEGKSLTLSEKKDLEEILAQKVRALKDGRYDPIPGNTETLFFGEELFSWLLTLSLLPFFTKAFSKKQNQISPRLFPTLLSLLLLWSTLLLLLSLSLWGVTALFAPQSCLPRYTSLFGRPLALPFFPSLFLRLLCRALPGLLPLLLGATFSALGKRGWICTAIPLLLLVFDPPISFFLRLFCHSSPLIFLLPSLYLDLDDAFFPTFPQALPRTPSPFLSLFLFAALFALFLLLIKKALLRTGEERLQK